VDAAGGSNLRGLSRRERRGAGGVKFEDLGRFIERLPFASIDHLRPATQGHPEVILCQGKTPEQTVAIAERLDAAVGSFLATRAESAHRAALAARFPGAEVSELGRTVYLPPTPEPEPTGRASAASRRCSARSTPARRASPWSTSTTGSAPPPPRAASITRERAPRGRLGRARPRRARPGGRDPGRPERERLGAGGGAGRFCRGHGPGAGTAGARLARGRAADSGLRLRAHPGPAAPGARGAGGVGRG